MSALLTIFLLTWIARASSQTKDSAHVVISHVFFCIDSLSYQNLFKHEFIASLFAYTSESTGKTLTDSWTGKYLNGRQSYIEVFAPPDKKTEPQLGDKFGDLGIVFRTIRPGDIQKIEEKIKENTTDYRLDLMKYESKGIIIPFNYNLYLLTGGLQETFRPYVEEFTVDFLKQRGFSDNEIRGGITEEKFREKRRGNKYDRLFDNIVKIELILTQNELESLSGTLKYLGFTRTEQQFTNGEVEILYSVQKNRPYPLKAIYFSLINETKSITIEISKNLIFQAKGITASLQFNYQ